MSIEDYIPKRLEDLFEKYEVSRYRISQKCGIPTTAISKIISKKNVPTIITLERICNAFGITLAQFFDDDRYAELSGIPVEIIKAWDSLDTKEQEIILRLVRSMQEVNDEK